MQSNRSVIPDDDIAKLTPLRDRLASFIAPASRPPDYRSHGVTVPSVEMHDVTVTVGLTVGDPSSMGTFDRTANMRWVQVSVLAYGVPQPGADPPGSRSPMVELPYREQIAWVRGVLGDLADWAYKVVTDRGLVKVRPAFFVVFVDGDGGPRLAPSDFQWLLASSGGRRAYPEKLVPDDPTLLSHIRKHGDLVYPDSVRHPQAAPPAVWAQQFLSHVTSVMADYLGRMGRSEYFTVEEVSLRGENRVVVRYIWHLNSGDNRFGFDIDLAGLRENRLRAFDDPRADTAGFAIGRFPFEQPVFPNTRVVDGVTWVDFGTPDVPADVSEEPREKDGR